LFGMVLVKSSRITAELSLVGWKIKIEMKSEISNRDAKTKQCLHSVSETETLFPAIGLRDGKQCW